MNKENQNKHNTEDLTRMDPPVSVKPKPPASIINTGVNGTKNKTFFEGLWFVRLWRWLVRR